MRSGRRDPRRAELDQAYVARFAARVRELCPLCPNGRETVIAEHACRKFSGRIGRSGAAKSFDPDAVRLAVVAHIRHAETPYDDLLLSGCDRHDARARVREAVDQVLSAWGVSCRLCAKISSATVLRDWPAPKAARLYCTRALPQPAR